jgi:hypothetical protein
MTFSQDEMNLRALIVITSYERKQENIIYFTTRYIFDNPILNITSAATVV